MKNLAVFISGTGTNLRTISEFCIKNPDLASVQLVISNKENVGGLAIAKEFGIPSVIIPTKGKTMQEFEIECEKHLYGVDLICLAGFMRILTQEFTNKWHKKMINIHPSLLPSFKGGDAINSALNFGVKVTGCTVHFVEPEIDSGEIISQKVVDIKSEDTFDTLKRKIQAAEKICYTEALSLICC